MPKAPTGTKYDKMFESIQIPVILTPIFISSYSYKNEHYALNMKTVNSRQCTQRILSLLEHTLLSENQESMNARSFNLRSTFVPFKEDICSSTTDESMLIFTHNIEIENLNETDVLRNGTETIVRGKRGIPLSMDEMEEFFEILRQCARVNLKRNDPLKEIKELGNYLLKNKAEAQQWEDLRHDDFLEDLQNLRALFQKEYKYRLGICDGAHRATVIFNAMYGYTISDRRLVGRNPVPIHRWHPSVTYPSQWDIWKHDDTGEYPLVNIYQVDFKCWVTLNLPSRF